MYTYLLTLPCHLTTLNKLGKKEILRELIDAEFEKRWTPELDYAGLKFNNYNTLQRVCHLI